MYPLIFNKVQISTNYEKLFLKFVVLSTSLDRLGIILSVKRKITSIERYTVEKTVIKRVIVESKRVIYTWSIDHSILNNTTY
jgi:hypothetical protein